MAKVFALFLGFSDGDGYPEFELLSLHATSHAALTNKSHDYSGYVDPVESSRTEVGKRLHGGARSMLFVEEIEVFAEKGQSSIAIVRDPHNRLLCVWNKRFNGWTLPGGKREPSDVDEAATMARELFEETGVRATSHKLVFRDTHENALGVFDVTAFEVSKWLGEPQECEPGCRVAWIPESDLLRLSPFTSFYVKLFVPADEEALSPPATS